MQELTKAQEDILRAIWKIDDGAISDVLETLPDPKPAYNTVATVIKVLEKKKYISHKTYGKTNVYFPIISKSEYAQNSLKNTVKGFFDGSTNKLVSHFVKNKDLDINELEELKEMLESEINKQKKEL